MSKIDYLNLKWLTLYDVHMLMGMDLSCDMLMLLLRLPAVPR